MFHSHKLNSTHSHIIGRTDPITGDSVQENDSVVFCAVCKSCFLEESWVYMNENHCEQSQTLETVPTLPSKLIAKKGRNEMITELRDTGINFNIVGGVTILSFLFSFFGLATSDTDFSYSLESCFTASLITTSLMAVVSSGVSATQTFKKIVGNDKNNVRLFKNRIEIGKDSFSLNDIKQIKYQREMNTEDNSTNLPSLLIYFENGKFLKKNLPTKSYKKTEVFLKGLEKISHFTEVFFYSESWKELQTMNTIQSNSNGNIEIGKPKKTVDYHGRVVFTSLDE